MQVKLAGVPLIAAPVENEQAPIADNAVPAEPSLVVPETSNLAAGFVVPIPTLPPINTAVGPVLP